MAKSLKPLVIVCILALLQVGWAQAPRAVATVGMIGDVAAAIGGTCVAVDTLMGPGTDPHLYQAKASDVRTMQQSDIILYAGYQLEGQLGDVLDRLGERRPVLAVAEAAVPADALIKTNDAYGIDPHVWMDVSLWADTVHPIAEALVEIAPDCGAQMRDRAIAYEATLRALDDWVRASIGSIPERQRILVTAHDAFGYFGRAYAIDVVGIQGVSTEAEPSIADIRSTVDVIVERDVPAVFVESTINPRTVQAVVAAAEQRGHDVVLGSELYSDAMGEAGTPDGTYVGMIVHNTRSIVEALGGTLADLPPALSEWASQWGGLDLP